MSLHQLFPVTRPAPVLFPDTLDGLCFARLAANRMGDHIVNRSTALPLHLARVLGDYERRLNARIAQVVA